MKEFLNSTFTLGNQVVILFVMMAVGFACTKAKFITEKSIGGLVNILLYVVTPGVIINSFLSVEFTTDTIISLATAAGCAVVSHIIGILISHIVCDRDSRKKAVLRFGTVFSNAGYMGLPLAQAVFHSEGVFFVSAYVIVYNVMQWTYGISLYQKGKNSLMKILINPGTIGVAIGLPLFLFKVSLPEIILTPLSSFASMNTPLAMTVTGYYLACSNLKEGMANLKMWLTIIFKMIVVPLIALCVFKYVFSLSGVLLCSCVLPAAAPCAVNTMILASKYKSDTDMGLRLVTISTLLSVITMPLILSLAQL